MRGEAMKFKKGEKVLWHGTPAFVHGVMTKNPTNGKAVKWYEIKRDVNSVASHLVSEDSNTLEKLGSK
jgi:hypothetical protein